MRYVIWNDADFTEEKIASTADKILANEALIHLLEPSEELRLHQAIERMAKLDDIDNMMLTRLRFAYNLHFDLPVELRKCADAGTGVPVGEAKSFAELVEMLPEDEARDAMDDYRIVIDDLKWDEQSGEEKQEDKKDTVKRMIAEIFQQFVFLNLNMDIMSKSEIKETIVKERFRKEYQNLKKRLSCAIAVVDEVMAEGMLSPKGQEQADRMKVALQNIETQVQRGHERPIRIAAMGTKKAGKSVIINTLLGQEYAPTSSELPTPNVIQYIPAAPDSGLLLEYKGKNRGFDSVEELRTYIEKEFEEAQQHTGEGAGLSEMVIHYPTEEFTGFEIYDTPGPNFAGAGDEHEKIAKDCIEKVDVCIFVINYSAHLTKDEVEFLQNIHTFFKEKGKFYSLLIAINRIDERYSAPVEKSVTRAVDYIRKLMEGLEYPNIVTFGTSALQSFYLEKIRQLCGQGDVGIDCDTIEKMVVSKDNRRWMTELAFIEASLRQLKLFHGYEKPTANDLELMSGIPQLRRYVHYIGAQKAELEFVNSIIRVCFEKMANVKNALGVTVFKELAERDRAKMIRLEKAILELQTEVGKIIRSGLDYVISQNAESEIKNYLLENRQENEEEACKRIKDGIEELVDHLAISQADMEAIYGEIESPEIVELQETIELSIQAINQEIGRKIQNGVAKECEDLASDFGKAMKGIQAKIKAAVERIDRGLEEEGEKDVQRMFRKFEPPQFPMGVEFPKVNVVGIQEVLDSSQLQGEAAKVREYYREERKAQGWVETIRSWFGKKYYREGHTFKGGVFKSRLKEIVIEAAQQAMQDVLEEAMPGLENQISRYIEQLIQQRNEYEDNYNEIFTNYMNMLQLLIDAAATHEESMQRDIAAFADMNLRTQPLFDLFDDIIEPMQEV